MKGGYIYKTRASNSSYASLKDDQFNYFLYFICFHIQEQLILLALALNLLVLTEMSLEILNMPHQIVGQVGVKV